MRLPSTVVLTLFAGCADPLPSPSTVDVLRVLTLTTTTPEVRPGEGLAVRAVWFDPVGDRPIRWRWRLCDPGAADDPRVCATPGTAVELGSGDRDRVELPAAALGLRAGEPDRTWVVYALACPSADAVLDPVARRLVCPHGVGSEVFRRVTMRATAPLNQPPPIADWSLSHGGSPVALTDGAVVSLDGLSECAENCPPLALTLSPSPTASEAFAETPESLLGSVYVTSGSVSPPRVANEPGSAAPMAFRWTPTMVVRGREVARVWAVLRDQRGGETVRAVAIIAR